jgi:hypothetical protein
MKLRDGHPRVLVRPDDLSALRRRAATTHAAEMQSLLALAASGAEPGPGGDYHESIWRLAFLYLLTGDAAHARLVVAAVNKLLDLPVSGEYFTGARRLKALAATYDWLHPALPADLRHTVGTRALEYCQALYDSGEVEPGIYLLGHAINQMPFILMAGIAVGDEIDAGRRSRQFIADTLARWEQQAKGYRHFLEQSCFQQSMSYTSTYVGEFPYLFSAIEAGLGVEMYRSNEWFRNVVTWWTYALRDDDTFVRYGDYFCAIPLFENQQYYRPLAAIASRYRDPLAQWWVNRFQMSRSEPEQILFEDRPGVASQPPADLPRTKLFAPMGLAIARGDFGVDGNGGTVAAFKCTPVYLHNHGHRDANSFTIYHKGDLAIDSGAYDAYETPHWYNYYIRTIAHNTVVIHDPQEKFVSRGREYANDGGQRFINEPHFQPTTLEAALSPAFGDGAIVAFREGDGWSYACGDASNCYRREKLTRFLRHAVFILDWPRPKCVSMLVLDEIELAREGLDPRFLLHTMKQPRVDGNQVVTTHGGGRLTATALIPRSPRIELIGGPGREFEVARTNYPLNRQMVGPHTPGAWRAEITGGEGRARRFLTLLTPADVDSAAEPPASVVEQANGYLVRQGELAVVLARGGKSIAADAPRVIRIELAD